MIGMFKNFFLNHFKYFKNFGPKDIILSFYHFGIFDKKPTNPRHKTPKSYKATLLKKLFKQGDLDEQVDLDLLRKKPELITPTGGRKLGRRRERNQRSELNKSGMLCKLSLIRLLASIKIDSEYQADLFI